MLAFLALALAASTVAVQLPPARPLPAPVQNSVARPVGPQDGITVRGNGTANAQATRALLTLTIVSRERNRTLTENDVAPIIDALVQAGVPRAQISVPEAFSQPPNTNFIALRANVPNPSVDMIRRGITLLASAFAAAPGLLLQNGQVQVFNDTCTSAWRQAQDAALSDARSQAQHLARELNVRLGPILAVDEQSPMIAGGQCSSSYQLGPYGNIPQNVSDYLTIRVYGNIMLRYAIR